MGIFDPNLPSLDPSSVSNALGIPNPFGNKGQVRAQAPVTTPVNPTPPAQLQRKIQSFSDAQQQTNWNSSAQALPYFFKICQTDPNGVVVNTPIDVPDAILAQMGLQRSAFMFYIAPSALTVQNTFAINVAATNQGILEEHNGVVFRNISIAGTTGLLPAKTNRAKTTQPGLLAAAQSLFPATTAAISSLVQNAKNVARAVVGGNDGDLQSINSQLDFTQTGWFQFWQLNNFLIAYSEYKKTAGSGLRLVFGSSKDNIGYVVTPISFQMKKDINNPLLYRYEIQLKAWDITVNISAAQLPQADIPSPDSQSIIKSVTGVLTTSRQTIQSATNVLQGVSSDLLSVYNVYNQALLLYQDTAGLVTDVRTFLPTFVAQRQSLLLNSSRNQSAILSAVNDASVRAGNTPEIPASVAVQISKSQNLNAQTAATLAALGVNTAAPPASTTPGGEQTSDPQKQSISPEANTLVTSALSTDEFKNLTIDQLDIPPQIQKGIDSTRSSSQDLTAGNIFSLCDSLQQISDNYAISLGSMDATYASTFQVPQQSVSAIHRTPTEDDIITEVALQEAKSAFLSTLATGQFFLERDPDPFLDANQYLQSPDFVNTPNSYYPVPFQRGSTLDTLAQQYLGDAKRSREIEILNYLRAPYIDETGFTQSILGPNGRTFVVTDISKLAIGQKVQISSNSAVTTTRHILNIVNIGNNEWRISVDGLPNLAMYTPASLPQIFARLPGTVGPGDTILIPSEIIPNEFAAIRPTPLYDNLAAAEKVFLVDISLDAERAQDLAIGANGDVQLSYGYNNAAQALRLAVEVEQGELDRHPSYGLATPVGSRNSTLTTAQIESTVRNTILNDHRFINADTLVQVNGDVVKIDINAQGASGTGQIPVSFEVGKL